MVFIQEKSARMWPLFGVLTEKYAWSEEDAKEVSMTQYDCDTRISVARQKEREKVGKGFLHHTLTNLTKSKYCFWTWLLDLTCSMHLDSWTPDVRLLAGYAVLAAKQAAIGFWGIANNAFISFFGLRNWKSMELVKICELVVKLFTLLLCFNSLPSKSNKRL